MYILVNYLTKKLLKSKNINRQKKVDRRRTEADWPIDYSFASITPWDGRI